jgi:hypothetical protein
MLKVSCLALDRGWQCRGEGMTRAVFGNTSTWMDGWLIRYDILSSCLNVFGGTNTVIATRRERMNASAFTGRSSTSAMSAQRHAWSNDTNKCLDVRLQVQHPHKDMHVEMTLPKVFRFSTASVLCCRHPPMQSWIIQDSSLVWDRELD